jgi:hypothetical protein
MSYKHSDDGMHNDGKTNQNKRLQLKISLNPLMAHQDMNSRHPLTHHAVDGRAICKEGLPSATTLVQPGLYSTEKLKANNLLT